MSKKLDKLVLGLDEGLEEKLKIMFPDYSAHRILRESLDARHTPQLIYQLEVFEKGESPVSTRIMLRSIKKNTDRPIIIGAGPAGLFAALRLTERGIPCDIYEQGSRAPERLKKIVRFWRYGVLDPQDNVGFGEGGAGFYSDGKLMTRIKSPHIAYVMQRLVDLGAPKEIEFLANPHVGSDKIRRLLPRLREAIEARGGRFFFNTKVEELLIENQSVKGIVLSEGEVKKSPFVILACGHSADPLIRNIKAQGVHVDAKAFALGLRIEHPQKFINKIQFKKFSEHPRLGAANYKLTHHESTSGVGVYSFCMCPGGYVLSAATEAGLVVSNGMSNFNRNSPYANSALVVTVNPGDLDADWESGMNFRRSIEKAAHEQVLSAGGSKELPAQLVQDFLEGRTSRELDSSCPSGVVPTRLDQLLPPWIKSPLEKALFQFERKMKGFLNTPAVFHGVESRTSCPVRITRDPDTLESLSHPGLYPAGEGAGYAGGITSAAVDGIRIAEKIYDLVKPKSEGH